MSIDAELERFHTFLDQAADRIVAAYGVAPTYADFLKILDDRQLVPYRVHFVFSDENLQPGEFGFMLAMNGTDPREGFVLYMHPCFRDRTDEIGPLIAYQLVVAFAVGPNGPLPVSRIEAERFGARLMGLDEAAFYQQVCDLADSMSKA